MADLHETLEQRERRSRLVSFLVGSAIILAIVVGVVWFNNRNDSGEVADEGVNITATEDADDSGSNPNSSDNDSGDQVDDSSGDDSNDADTSVASRDDDVENRSNGDDATDTTSSAGDADSNSEGTAADDDAESDEQPAVATTGGTDSEGELPNTGPGHAVIGLIGVVIATRLFVKTRTSLDNILRS